MTRRWSATRGSPQVCSWALRCSSSVVPLLPGYDPYAQDLAGSLRAVRRRSRTADLAPRHRQLGRDMLSRLALAGQVSIFIGLGAVP